MAVSATNSPPRRTMEELMADVDRQGRVVMSRNLLFAAILLAIVWYSAGQTEFHPDLLITKAHNMERLLVGFFHPNLAIVLPKFISGSSEIANGKYGYSEGLLEHFAFQTLTIAIFGTFLGTVVAIPTSFLAARNLTRRGAVGTALYFAVRTVMSVVRSIPTLFWGLLFVTAISTGPFAGVMAISLFSFGLMSKLFSEAIEAIDWGQVEALTATGANPVQVVTHGVVPQVMPYLVAHLLYTFEVNVHSATILGVIGAGGLGFLFQQYAETFDYESQAMLLYVTIVMTALIDNSSAAIRRRII